MMIPPASPGTQGTAAAPQRTAAGEAQQATAQRSAQQFGSDGLQRSVDAANRSARSLGSSVQFNIDSRSGKAVVRVVDSETGQVIRQIPSEEMLELRRALDRIAGLVIDEKA